MLNENQLNDIRHFCHSKGVIYYDLEQEIVDHLASVMEEEQNRSAEKSFEEILQTKTNEFSAEWKTIETEKRKSLRREYLREFGKEFVSYFTIPKILITISSMIVTYFFLKIFQKNISASVSFLLNVTGIIVNLGYGKKNRKVKAISDSRRYSLISYNVFKNMKLLLTFLVIFYLVIFIAIIFIFRNTSIYLVRINIELYPIFFISLLSLNLVQYSFLNKIKNNYPLAFQN